MVSFHYKELKTISKNTKLIDTYFISRVSVSPYRSCVHDCKYCDGRAEKYYIEGSFEKDIVVRRNTPDLLDEKLKKSREKGFVMLGSGTSDPYQFIELKEKLTREILKRIKKNKHSVIIMTKSANVLRDIDILREINSYGKAIVMFSLTYSDDVIRKDFEPYASPVAKRLNAIKVLKENGIAVGILAMPFLPFINDSYEQIKSFTGILKKLKVDFIIPGALTLRPGIQKEYFMDVIEEKYPLIFERYQELYNKKLSSGAPKSWYVDELMDKIHDILQKYKIPMYIPHYLYKGVVPVYDEISILLAHMEMIYSSHGIDISRLKRGRKQYNEYLSSQRSYYNKKRSLRYTELESRIVSSIENGQMINIIDNNKIIEFLKEIVVENKEYDYINKKIIIENRKV
jgi:DNA repair photolyase